MKSESLDTEQLAKAAATLEAANKVASRVREVELMARTDARLAELGVAGGYATGAGGYKRPRLQSALPRVEPRRKRVKRQLHREAKAAK